MRIPALASARVSLWVALAVLMSVPAFPQRTPPPLQSIRFEGGAPPGKEKLLKDLAQETGAPFEPEQAQRLSDGVLKAWQLEGYPLAKVKWTARAVHQPMGLELVLQSEPGERGVLKVITFTGNRRISREELMSVLNVVPKEGFWNRVTGRNLLWIEDLNVDAYALLALYHSRGMMGATIDPPAFAWDPELGGYRVDWTLTEGEPYRFGTIRYADTPPEWVSQLARKFEIQEGALFTPERTTRFKQSIQERFHEWGYAFSTVEVLPEWKEEEHRVDLMVRIKPGSLARLNQVNLTGNEKTNEDLILRELLLQKGDPFQPVAIRFFQDRLVSMGLFSSVDVSYQQVNPDGGFDLNVEVQEAATGRVETGVSYGTEEGPGLLLQFSERNFSPYPPFRGDGWRFNAGGLIGPDLIRVNTGLINPRVGNGFWSMGGSLFYEDNQYISDLYDQRSIGAGFTVSYPMLPSLEFFTGPQWTLYELNNVDPAIEEEDIAESDVRLSGWEIGLAGDWTDRPFRPLKGVRLEPWVLFGTELLGGDTEVLEVNAKAAIYMNPYQEHVLMLRGGIHSIEPTGSTDVVPLSLRSFLGGVDNLRGFEYRTVSPLDANGNPVGGLSSWWMTLEYLIPVLPRLDLSLYTDLGDVSPDAYTFEGEGPVGNWGIGFLIRAENFPVRFDYAVPFSVTEGDLSNEAGEGLLSFSAGYRF